MTLTRLRTLVAAFGGSVEIGDAPRAYEILVNAPEGMQWKSGGVTQLVSTCMIGSEKARAELRKDLAERVHFGIEEVSE